MAREPVRRNHKSVVGAAKASNGVFNALEHRFRFKLLTDQEIANLPPITWRIDQYVPQGGLTFLYGPSAVGKSFLALSWAMAVATGAEWMGRKVTPGPVVYVAAEGGRGF